MTRMVAKRRRQDGLGRNLSCERAGKTLCVICLFCQIFDIMIIVVVYIAIKTIDFQLSCDLCELRCVR